MASTIFTRKYAASIRLLERKLESLEDRLSRSKESLDAAQRDIRQTRQKLVTISKNFVNEAQMNIRDLQAEVDVLRKLNDDKDNEMFLTADLEQQPDSNDTYAQNHTEHSVLEIDSRCDN